MLNKPEGVHQCQACYHASDKLKPCSGCQNVHYCNTNCQKNDWKSHKPFCHHNVETSARIEQETEGYRLETEKYLKKWSESHRTLLTWAAFNALKLKAKPDNASSKGLQLVLHRNSSVNPSKAFVIITAKVVEIDDILQVAGNGISQKISAAVLEDRAREAANPDSVFPLIFLICEGLAQVMAVGINDSDIVPEGFRKDEEWEMTLNRFGVE